MAQGELPCTAIRSHFLPDAIVSAIATESGLSVITASPLELASCEHPENQRNLHLGENWKLSENGGTKRTRSLPAFFPNLQRRLSCVWFEIVKRMTTEDDDKAR